jgi:hypothetical protein
MRCQGGAFPGTGSKAAAQLAAQSKSALRINILKSYLGLRAARLGSTNSKRLGDSDNVYQRRHGLIFKICGQGASRYTRKVHALLLSVCSRRLRPPGLFRQAAPIHLKGQGGYHVSAVLEVEPRRSVKTTPGLRIRPACSTSMRLLFGS